MHWYIPNSDELSSPGERHASPVWYGQKDVVTLHDEEEIRLMSTLWFTGFWWNSVIGWGNLGNTMWWQLKLFLVINKKEIKKYEKTSDALKCFFQTFYLPALLFSKTMFSIAPLSWSWFLVAGVKKNSNELSFRERGGKRKRNVSKFPFWGSQGTGPLLLSLE